MITACNRELPDSFIKNNLHGECHNKAVSKGFISGEIIIDRKDEVVTCYGEKKVVGSQNTVYIKLYERDLRND